MAVDEFKSIGELFRPLTFGAPEALDLMDDAAAIPSRPDFDLIVTKDAMVEGVHFLPSDAPELVAKKLLRVNLSDLAAKGAEPYAYFLAVAWPKSWGERAKAAFASGLMEDQARFGLKLFGGDTVSTPGPLTLSVTMLGWAHSGAMVRRSGACAGDVVLVSGTIGDGWLGLAAAQGKLYDLGAEALRYLSDRYRLPQPRIALQDGLRRHASAAADVSDGLLADAGHIGAASRLGVEIDVDRLPLSRAATAWLHIQSDRVVALTQLATGGDDYEIVCAVSPAKARNLIQEAKSAGLDLAPIGRMVSGSGVQAFFAGRRVDVAKLGWAHS